MKERLKFAKKIDNRSQGQAVPGDVGGVQIETYISAFLRNAMRKGF